MCVWYTKNVRVLNGRGVAPDDHWYTKYATEFTMWWLQRRRLDLSSESDERHQGKRGGALF